VSTKLSLRDLPDTAATSNSQSTVPVVRVPSTIEELAKVAAPAHPYKTLPQPQGTSTPTKSKTSSRSASSGVQNSIVRVVVDLESLEEDTTEESINGN